jgi:hypothetical protein
LIVNGRAYRAAVPVVPVVPQSLSYTPVTVDPGPVLPSYSVNAAFMSFEQHGSGIHAVRSGAGEASVTEVLFRCARRPVARRDVGIISPGSQPGAQGHQGHQGFSDEASPTFR